MLSRLVYIRERYLLRLLCTNFEQRGAIREVQLTLRTPRGEVCRVCNNKVGRKRG